MDFKRAHDIHLREKQNLVRQNYVLEMPEIFWLRLRYVLVPPDGHGVVCITGVARLGSCGASAGPGPDGDRQRDGSVGGQALPGPRRWVRRLPEVVAVRFVDRLAHAHRLAVQIPGRKEKKKKDLKSKSILELAAVLQEQWVRMYL